MAGHSSGRIGPEEISVLGTNRADNRDEYDGLDMLAISSSPSENNSHPRGGGGVDLSVGCAQGGTGWDEGGEEDIHSIGALGANLNFPNFSKWAQLPFKGESQGKEALAIGLQ